MNMNKYILRINGRGNAWPIPIEQHHPFYSLPDAPDYANASYSLFEADEKGKVSKDILIDAGHGIVPFLLKHGNRIPDALLITHPHLDHTLGMDWIIQSYVNYQYLLDFLRDFPEKEDYALTVLDFTARIHPKNLLFSHYSGLEDEKYYKRALLDTPGLEQWGRQIVRDAGLDGTVRVPETGEIIALGPR